MPKPLPNETKEEYIPRCIEYIVKNEGAEQKAAVGKCYGLWDYFNKKNITEKISDYIEEEGTVTADIDITPTADKPKKKKKKAPMLRRRLQSTLLGV
jgi:hypothetical protein